MLRGTLVRGEGGSARSADTPCMNVTSLSFRRTAWEGLVLGYRAAVGPRGCVAATHSDHGLSPPDL